MSLESSPEPTRRSPKRKRAPPHEQYDGAEYEAPGNADLSYAYDDDLTSDAENVFATPDQGSDDEVHSPKRRKVERPQRLNYVPYLTLRGHKRGVAAVKVSPDGKWIASCSADTTIKIWNAQTGQLTQTLEGHMAGISTIAWSPDSTVVASGSDDKLIRLWNISTGKSFPVPLQGHHNYVYSVAFSPKGNMLVSGSYDEAVFLWDIRTAQLMRTLPAHSDPVSGVDFVRDGTLIASCSSDGLIRIWDTSTGQCLKTVVHEDNAPVTSVKFSPNGKYVVAATLDSCLRLWDYVTGRCLKTYQGHKNEKFSLNACFGTYGADHKSSPSGMPADDQEARTEDEPSWAFVACGSEDGKTMLWDVSSKEILQVVSGHDGAVLGIDFNLADQSLVTAGLDKTVRVWKRQPLPPEVEEHAKVDAHEKVNVETTLPVRSEQVSDEEQIKDSDT